MGIADSVRTRSRRRALLRFPFLLILAVVLSLPAPAAAADFGKPVPGQHVYDRAGVLSASEIADLERRAAAVQQAGAPVVVYLRLQHASASATENDAASLMEAWDVQSTPDARDGLVFFLNLEPTDPRHGQVAIFAGAHHTRGGNLPQYELQRILNQSILPLLRQGKIANGIGAGLDAAANSLISGPAPPPPPNAVQRFAEAAASRPLSPLNVLSAAAAVAALVVGLRAYRSAPRRRGPVVPTTLPPGSRPPAEVGALVRGGITLAQIEGTILDLARRGALAVEPSGKRQIRLRLQDGSLTETPYEKAVWEILAGAADPAAIVDSRAFRRLAGRWGPAQDALRRVLLEQGLFDPAAGRRRMPAFVAGAVAFGLGLAVTILCAVGGQVLGAIGGGVLMVAGVVCVALGTFIRSTTDAGESEAGPWRSYEAGIKAARGDRAAILDLDEVVPYAAALGVVGSLDRRLKTASEAGYAPVWLGQALGGATWDGGFYPYWIAFHGAAVPASGGGTSAGGAAAGGAGASGSF